MPSDLTRRGFLESAATAAILGSGTTLAAAPSEAGHAAQPRPSKILGICCSPRKGKSTAAALRIGLDAIKAFDGRIEVELIELAGRKIPGEVAAGIALEPGERDDFPARVPKLSSPQRVMRPASSRLPKNFQPVGVSKQEMPSALATTSTAALVGIERATPESPPA